MTLESYLRTAGPTLAPAEIKAALRGQLNSPPVKAVLELLVQHIATQQGGTLAHPAAHESPEERHYHAGATASAEDFLAALGEYIES